VTTSAAPAAPTGSAPSSSAHVGWAILALATGGFTIGTTEFVTMGLLPEITGGVCATIPEGGHLISAYALGVVVGAPLLAFFGAAWPRRALLIALMAAYGLFNLLSAGAQGFGMLFIARFLDGLPHGAYFGVASLVAAGLVDVSRKGRAVAAVMLGLSVANVLGVPVATWVGQHVGWRAAFGMVAALSAVTVAMIWAFVPACPGDSEASGRRELAAFGRVQVWLTLAAGAIGFGGLFAVFSYIAPTVTEVGGLGSGAVPVFLTVLGLGMVGGTWAAGHLADWSVLRSLFIGGIGLGLALALFWVLSRTGWFLLPAAFGVTFLGSVLVVNLQLRLMDVAGEAQTLGAAMNHASLNVGNALGAWIGGLVIAAGHGYRAPALAGVGLALAGVVVLVVAAVHARRIVVTDLAQKTEKSRV